ncbi:hypothetical protein [Micromonospora sp. NBC_01813]|uniref:hypothetical protein n=1 Tax=Micromonospora sp. NBC_01813 TaxID=2975988 RepID=UPI002DD83CD5|nr:hypothetical protein [Micromonospora sp. NBC_01813]WSA09760.1 hypothetical protein OG958_02790 [Micromonospora sp. NBC_01813]
MTNVKYPQLSGLGRNPAASDDLLVRLAAHAAGRHGMSLRRGRLADPVVEALLAHGGSDTAIHLNGERVSTRMRKVIAEHPDPAIRHAYANFIRTIVDRNVSLGIESLEEAFGESRFSLVDSSDPKLRAAVANTWSDRPPAVQLRLLADSDPSVRAAATLRRHPGVPAEWWERCLTDPATRVNVARYVPLTVAQATNLIGSGDLEVCRAVAANPDLPAEAVGLLLELDDPQVRVAVAYSRHVDADTRDRLFALVAAEADAGSVAAYVALSWNFDEPGWLRTVPLAERLAYLDCPHPPFRRVLASCRDLPDAAWERLDNDPDLRVRRYAAARPDAPAAVLERLVRAGGAPQIRYVALEDPDLPEEVLARLAVDSEAVLRRGAARHPYATPALLEQLLADDDPEVVDEAAANPQLPLHSMHRILDESAL